MTKNFVGLGILMDYSTKTLAKGCFGKVYKEKYNDTWAALKKVPAGFINKAQLERECKVYYSAHHNNVVKLLGDPWLQDGKWHIPMEFIFGEDLETTIFNVQKSKIQLTQKVKGTIITGMCEGLFHLHSKDIVHQDLKPDNIMIEHETHRAVIIDMGLAKFFVNGLSSAQNMGNEAYSPPEVLLAGGVRNKRSDVWAMGKIIAELTARVRLPTTFVSPVKIMETLKDNPYCNVVCKMVATDASERASMIQIISEIRRIGVLLKAETGVKAGAGGRAGVGARAEAGAGVGVRERAGNPGIAGARSPSPYPKWRQQPHSPPKVPAPETPVVHINRSRSPQPGTLVPLNNNDLATELSKLSIPCNLPLDGTVIQRLYNQESGQLEIKEIVTKNGKIVKYEDVKITKA